MRAAEKSRVGRKKKTSGVFDEQFNLVVTKDWLRRVEAEAARRGLSASSYVRQAVMQALDRDEAERAAREKEGGE
jgi:hypothetical protein